MSAIVIILPGNPVDPLADDKLHEQRIQEEIALITNRKGNPPRSRPVLVVEPPCTVWVELTGPHGRHLAAMAKAAGIDPHVLASRLLADVIDDDAKAHEGEA
jgi:hypothetical protein